MITSAHACMMARYNRWQNRGFFEAASTLSDSQRREDRGAFFGSLHTTLAHILWADRVWMNRFAGTPPTSLQDDQGKGPAYANWEGLKSERSQFDDVIVGWADDLEDDWLAADFTWSNVAKTRTATQPAWRLVAHFFNHQTHHRGQAHAILTAFGVEMPDTDLFLLPPNDGRTDHLSQ